MNTSEFSYDEKETLGSLDMSVKYTADHNSLDYSLVTADDVLALQQKVNVKPHEKTDIRSLQKALDKAKKNKDAPEEITRLNNLLAYAKQKRFLALKKEEEILEGVQAFQGQLYVELTKGFSEAGEEVARDLNKAKKYKDKAEKEEKRRKTQQYRRTWLLTHGLSAGVSTEPVQGDQAKPDDDERKKRLRRSQKIATIDFEKLEDDKNKLNLKPVDAGSKFFKTDNAYTVLGWFTSLRLFLVRFNRLANFWKHPFLKKWFAILGFSYAIELIVDIAVVLKETFRPATAAEKAAEPSRAKRMWNSFKNTLLKDNRPIRMLNALVWLAVNVTAFVLTGGLSVVARALNSMIANALNVAGFSFDVLVEVYNGIRDYVKHTKLINKLLAQKSKLVAEVSNSSLITEIEKLKAEIQQANDKGNVDLAEQKQASLDLKTRQLKAKGLTPETINAKQLDIQKIDYLVAALKEKRRAAISEAIYKMICTGLILVGMILFCFPPTTIIGGTLFGVGLGAQVLGAGFAAFAGSVFFGLGRRLWRKAKEFFTPTPSADLTFNPKIDNSTVQAFKTMASQADINQNATPPEKKAEPVQVTVEESNPNAKPEDLPVKQSSPTASLPIPPSSSPKPATTQTTPQITIEEVKNGTTTTSNVTPISSSPKFSFAQKSSLPVTIPRQSSAEKGMAYSRSPGSFGG